MHFREIVSSQYFTASSRRAALQNLARLFHNGVHKHKGLVRLHYVRSSLESILCSFRWIPVCGLDAGYDDVWQHIGCLLRHVHLFYHWELSRCNAYGLREKRTLHTLFRCLYLYSELLLRGCASRRNFREFQGKYGDYIVKESQWQSNLHRAVFRCIWWGRQWLAKSEANKEILWSCIRLQL